jgi:hypothetical protein
MYKYLILFAICSCQFLQPTPEKVCKHYQGCGFDFGGTEACLKDMDDIETHCPKTASTLEECLDIVPCTTDQNGMFLQVMACYRNCERW